MRCEKAINESKQMGVEGHGFCSAKCPSCGDWYNVVFMTEYPVQGEHSVLLCRHCLAAHDFSHHGVKYLRCDCGKYIRESDARNDYAECEECNNPA
jgi:hypothetical protein